MPFDFHFVNEIFT